MRVRIRRFLQSLHISFPMRGWKLRNLFSFSKRAHPNDSSSSLMLRTAHAKRSSYPSIKCKTLEVIKKSVFFSPRAVLFHFYCRAFSINDAYPRRQWWKVIIRKTSTSWRKYGYFFFKIQCHFKATFSRYQFFSSRSNFRWIFSSAVTR